jgi:hypothetical protein
MTQFEINKRQRAKIEKLEKEVRQLRRRVKSAEFWSKFVYPEGATPTDIQNELLDYHEMLGEVGKVYMHVTAGQISKPNTHAIHVIAEADQVTERAVQDALADYQEQYPNDLYEEEAEVISAGL